MALDQLPKIIPNSVPVCDNLVNFSIAKLYDNIKHIPHIGIIGEDLTTDPNSSQQKYNAKNNNDKYLLYSEVLYGGTEGGVELVFGGIHHVVEGRFEVVVDLDEILTRGVYGSR